MIQTVVKQKNERGVVLIEAIIAVGVLITIFTASLALYLGSVGGMRMTNDQLIATYLAQDGLEQVIAKRQYNYKHFDNWLVGIPTTCTTANPCAVDYVTYGVSTASLTACVAGCKLYIDPVTGLYSHNPAGTASYFSRSVSVEILEPDVEARVVVKVSWDDKGVPMALSLNYNLYNNPNNSMMP